jgi:hypothetical protein
MRLFWATLLALAGFGYSAFAEEKDVDSDSGRHSFKLEVGQLFHKHQGKSQEFDALSCQPARNDIVAYRAVSGWYRGGLQTLGFVKLFGKPAYIHVCAVDQENRLWYAFFDPTSSKWTGWRNLTDELRLPRVRSLQAWGWLNGDLDLTIICDSSEQHCTLNENGDPSWTTTKLPPAVPQAAVPKVYRYTWRLEAFDRNGKCVGSDNLTNTAMNDEQAGEFTQNKLMVWGQALSEKQIEYVSTRAVFVSKSPSP